MSIIEQIRCLNQAELFNSLSTLGNLVITASEQNPELLSPTEKYHVLVYYAGALYEEEEYKRSESYYRRAFHLKKSLNRCKGKSTQPGNVSEAGIPSDLDIKYRLYQCNYKLKNFTEAKAVLESIPAKQRSAKVNLALAKLYQRTGTERSAATAFKEVLRQCPLALEAAQGLLGLGVKGAEVESLTINSLHSNQNLDWLNFWFRGHAYGAVKEYSKAIATFKNLETASVLKENINVLCSLAEYYFLSGDMKNAIAIYSRIHSLEPLFLKGMDIYASILSANKDIKQLQNLSTDMMSVTERSPESWIAMGYYCAASGNKATRAVYFAQRAFQLDQRNVQALLLKGSVLKDIGKTQDALLHYREAVRLAPNRFEAHKGTVECLMKAGRIREAITTATNTRKVLGNTARCMTLVAAVLAKDRVSKLNHDQAKTMLERALALDSTYLEATYILTELYMEERNFDAAMALLRKHLFHSSTCRLHQMLGDCLAATNEHIDAIDQYNIALSLDNKNKKARDGLERVEKSRDNLDPGVDDEMEGMDESGEDVDYDASDAEVSWVDGGEWY
ncbi:anaphase-promoting complex subunit 7-like [Anneissia japonica]|uniref:anaphase-promoting complex subunit 7-like n=1 Tax=Anneissia japonica TaxID=1529436 RepID=UPI0014256C6F|nr:anaphase-promoting complex subunit 7-like [Anneissia japonica]